MNTDFFSRILFFALFITLSCSTGSAAIYEYTDDSGKTYYTDQIEKIPEKYRKKKEGMKVFLETEKLSKAEIKQQTQQVQKDIQNTPQPKQKSVMVESEKTPIEELPTPAEKKPKLSPKEKVKQPKPSLTPEQKIRAMRQNKGSSY